MTNTSANHYHRSRLIGKILQPCALFSQMRRLTEGTHLSGFCFSSHKAPAALDISEVGGVENLLYGLRLTNNLDNLPQGRNLIVFPPNGRQLHSEPEIIYLL